MVPLSNTWPSSLVALVFHFAALPAVMTMHSRSAAEVATERKDMERRAKEESLERVVEFVRDRGFHLDKSLKSEDQRVEHSRQPDKVPMSPKPTLVRTESYLALKAEQKSSGKQVPSYLKAGGGSMPALRKKKVEEQPKLTPAEVKAAVHEKTKSMVAEAQHKTLERAASYASKSDRLGVFDPRVNEMRALSVARRELRRSVTLEQIKRDAAEQVARGSPKRSEAAEAAAAAAAGGSVVDIRTPDLLRGRLELLDEAFAAKQKAAERAAKQQQQQQQGARKGQSGRQRGRSGELAAAGALTGAPLAKTAGPATNPFPRSASSAAHVSAGAPTAALSAMGASFSTPALANTN